MGLCFLTQQGWGGVGCGCSGGEVGVRRGSGGEEGEWGEEREWGEKGEWVETTAPHRYYYSPSSYGVVITYLHHQLPKY